MRFIKRFVLLCSCREEVEGAKGGVDDGKRKIGTREGESGCNSFYSHYFNTGEGSRN